MCGFAGQINLRGLPGDPEQRRAWLRAMGRQLARRGPDDEQFYDDGRLALVFRRLSVIDIEGGRQPMWNEDRSVLTAVNGEIYNHEHLRRSLEHRHRFTTRSDSEVIVHLYEDLGDAFLGELNGMFAMVAWDTRRRRLLLARDRLGIKPLFYAIAGDSLVFASELKALLAHPDCPRELDWRDLEHRPPEKGGLVSWVRGIRQLPGGHCLRVENGSIGAPEAWWSLREHFPEAETESAGLDAGHYVARYGELLRDSVRAQLMSDVPVGLFLSGGIDSTLLAALAADDRRDLHCFTVVEESTVQAGDVEEARRACEALGLSWHPVEYDTSVLADRLDYSLEQFEFLVAAVESPGFNLEWLLKHELHRFARSRVPALKVILLGQGADEFTGGYSRSLGNEDQTWPAYMARVEGIRQHERRRDGGVPARMHQALAPGYPPDDETPDLSPFQREMLARTLTLQNYNLWHEDRTSSCHGIEARVPFLDHRLVELAASVPVELHENLFFDKRIVREQLRRTLPSYPGDKLKVRFFLTGQEQSMNRLRAGIIRRVFPEFRRKYLARPGAIFSAGKMNAFHDRLAQGQRFASRDLDDFLDCMAISVFDRMCRERPEWGNAGDAPSPLRLWKQ